MNQLKKSGVAKFFLDAAFDAPSNLERDHDTALSFMYRFLDAAQLNARYKRWRTDTHASVVLHAIRHIKTRLSGHGGVANPRDTLMSPWFAPRPDQKAIVSICTVKHATPH